jgi:outer membrane protein OmpA-like peptidoglycan-associated protein
MAISLRILLCGFSALTLAHAESKGSLYAIPGDQGLPGVFETYSSGRMKAGAAVLGASSHISKGMDLVENGTLHSASGEHQLDEAFISSFRSFAAAGLGFGLDLSLILPFYYEYLPGARSQPESWGVGDFSGILKWKIPVEIPFASMSLFAKGSAPTSSRDGAVLPKELAYHPSSEAMPDPVSRATGMGKPRAGMGAGITFDLSDAMDGPRIALHLNVSGDRTMADASLNPLGILAASAALEAFLTDGLRLESEFRHQRLAADPSTLGSPVGKSTTVAFGLGWLTESGVALRFGGMMAPEAWNRYLPLTLHSGTGPDRTLDYRFQSALSGYLQVSWQGFPLGRDGDQDGIPDGRDLCPAIPEDRDGNLDGDGCPDPDNDGDGALDGSDNCPYTPEDHDGFEDRDGCPELDNDHDGFLDSTDRCPNDPEDRDSFQDEDGCPDLDDDKDGIPDAVDKCPREPENRNGVEDEDGCPESDTDGDRIPDSRDKCPREDEIVNFYQDEDGCPDEKPEPIRDAVLTGVEFQSGSSELLPGAFLILDGLAARMFAYPGTEIEVQGHLDDRAGTGAKALTQARAEAVVEYLVNRGIEARRMKPIGYGASKPIGPNRTAQGRAQNRRIQIRRLN